jgi:hypothetical protein
MQGDWAADSTTERGGQTMHTRWWLTASGGSGRGSLKTFSKMYLKIVPQIVQSPPCKIRFSKEVFA